MPTDDSLASDETGPFDVEQNNTTNENENTLESIRDSISLSGVSELTLPSTSSRGNLSLRSNQSWSTIESTVSLEQMEPKREATPAIEEPNARLKQTETKKKLSKNDSEMHETFNELNTEEKKAKTSLTAIKKNKKLLEACILSTKTSLINSLYTDVNNERIICERLEERLKKLEAFYSRKETERNSHSNENVSK